MTFKRHLSDHGAVIASFASKGTEDIFHGLDTKAARATCPKTLWAVARRKLDMLDAAAAVGDLKAPPANRLERLKGDLAGSYSIRVNDQYRVVFSFDGGRAEGVKIVDYH